MEQAINVNTQLTLKDINLLPNGVIGQGGFGSVVQCTVKNGTTKYALKRIDLFDLTPNELEHIKLEIKHHLKLKHPHIVIFRGVIYEDKKIYTLLDYAPNGDLFDWMAKVKKFDENTAAKIIYQVLQALIYCHERNIIHRDLKPENIQLDANWNCLLTDFGWSGEFDVQKRRQTYCGTYEYMAPEVVQRAGQDDKTDVWSLGVLTYELVHGKTPFVASTPAEINKKTLEGSIPINSHLSKEVKSFIKATLRHHAENRLSGKELIKHPLFIKHRLTTDDISQTNIQKPQSKSYQEEKTKPVIQNFRKGSEPIALSQSMINPHSFNKVTNQNSIVPVAKANNDKYTPMSVSQIQPNSNYNYKQLSPTKINNAISSPNKIGNIKNKILFTDTNNSPTLKKRELMDQNKLTTIPSSMSPTKTPIEKQKYEQKNTNYNVSNTKNNEQLPYKSNVSNDVYGRSKSPSQLVKHIAKTQSNYTPTSSVLKSQIITDRKQFPSNYNIGNFSKEVSRNNSPLKKIQDNDGSRDRKINEDRNTNKIVSHELDPKASLYLRENYRRESPTMNAKPRGDQSPIRNQSPLRNQSPTKNIYEDIINKNKQNPSRNLSPTTKLYEKKDSLAKYGENPIRNQSPTKINTENKDLFRKNSNNPVRYPSPAKTADRNVFKTTLSESSNSNLRKNINDAITKTDVRNDQNIKTSNNEPNKFSSPVKIPNSSQNFKRKVGNSPIMTQSSIIPNSKPMISSINSVLSTNQTKIQSDYKDSPKSYNSINKNHMKMQTDLSKSNLLYSDTSLKLKDSQTNVAKQSFESVLNKYRPESPYKPANNYSSTLNNSTLSSQKYAGSDRKSLDKYSATNLNSATRERYHSPLKNQVIDNSKPTSPIRQGYDKYPVRNQISESPKPASPIKHDYDKYKQTQRYNSPTRANIPNTKSNNAIINRGISQAERGRSPQQSKIVQSPVKGIHNLNSPAYKNSTQNIMSPTKNYKTQADVRKIDYGPEKYEVQSPTKLITSSEIKKNAPVIKLEKGSSYTSQMSNNYRDYNNSAQYNQGNYKVNTNFSRN